MGPLLYYLGLFFWKFETMPEHVCFVLLLQIVCVMAAVFGVIMYRIIIVAVLYASDDALIKQNAKITTTVTAALISLVVIVILNKVGCSTTVS